ncbi:MAG: L-histidine N(alpha)-methyltransferase [Limisphaerales bacterium]
MPTTLPVIVHASQFPDAVQRGLLEGLRSRRIPPKYLYESRQQAAKWLALHEAFSPARNDPEATAIYDRSYHAAAKLLPQGPMRLIGLGCGGGQKEGRLLAVLAGQGEAISYTPCDASLPLVITSAQQAEGMAKVCRPLLCDLAMADDLAHVFDEIEPRHRACLFTFFGIIPNFEPDLIMAKLCALLREGDLLLFSANLAPGPSYDAGVERVFCGYDNRETREWLLAFVTDLGIERSDGVLELYIEEASGLRRIAADFRFHRQRAFYVEGEQIEFDGGESLRLFFSFRYTPAQVQRLLRARQIVVLEQWVTPSEEEGVFLCRKIGVDA